MKMKFKKNVIVLIFCIYTFLFCGNTWDIFESCLTCCTRVYFDALLNCLPEVFVYVLCRRKKLMFQTWSTIVNPLFKRTKISSRTLKRLRHIHAKMRAAQF